MAKDKDKKEEDKIPVRLGDSFHTIIYINKGEDKERAIKKYYKDLEDYQKSGIMNSNKGRLRWAKH